METSASSIFSNIDSQDLQHKAAVDVNAQSVESSNMFSFVPDNVEVPQPMFAETPKPPESSQSELTMYKKLYEDAMIANKELNAVNDSLSKQLKECKLKIEFLEKQSKQDINKDKKLQGKPAKHPNRLSNAVENADASVDKICKDEQLGVLTGAVSAMSDRISALEDGKQATSPTPPPVFKNDGKLKVQQAEISTTSLAEDLVTSAIAKKNKWVANKDSFTADGFTFGYVNEELYVLKVATHTNKVDIPTYVDGIPVRGILGGAFATTISDMMTNITCAKTKLDLIYLPKTITHIDRGAFKGVNCANLIIPASVGYIAKDAFDGLTCDILRFACDQKLITSAIAGASIKTCVRIEEVK